jgi:putative thioredoxin
MRPTDIRLPGAVDLSTLKRPPQPASGGGAGAAGAGSGAGAAGGVASLVVDVTEQSFEAEVILRSQQVPVVIDFWAEWCGPCKQLSPVLERLVAADAGRWILAKIDVDAQQRLAAAFQIQSIPSVLAVIAGQPVPLFQGAVPEAQVRQVIDEVLRVAAANGVNGTVAPGTGDEAAAEDQPGAALDPELEAAYTALESGDLAAARAGFHAVVARSPGDVEAKLGLARTELLQRVEGLDEARVRMRAEHDPSDLDALTALSDFDVLADRVDHAIDRLVTGIRANSGAERDRLRGHLLSLFDCLEPDDPRLAAGRRALANALF